MTPYLGIICFVKLDDSAADIMSWFYRILRSRLAEGRTADRHVRKTMQNYCLREENVHYQILDRASGCFGLILEKGSKLGMYRYRLSIRG